MKIKNLIQFTSLLLKFRDVDRTLHAPGKKREENDVEHSYMLTMLAWYICSVEKLKLDLNKVIHYALAHDLVEIYAGDTFAYSKDKKRIASKHKREAAALKKIKKQFPEFKDLHIALSDFEKRKDPEAKFVYALDKVQAIIVVYIDKGYSWKRDKITLDMVRASKNEKVKLDPQVSKYWDEFLQILDKEEKRLFPKNRK